MTPGLYTVDEVSAMIREGKKLLLAGETKLLSQLPKGDWIGGTIPYFILYPWRRIESFDKLFVSCLPDIVDKVEICEYDSSSIRRIYCDAPQNGFTALIIPFENPVYSEYASNATEYEKFACFPVCGWVAQQHLEDTQQKPYACSGQSGVLRSDQAVAMHISLPANKYAEMHIINPLDRGSGDIITFDSCKRIVKDAVINGEKQNFAAYLRRTKREKIVDIGNMPLVADYSGVLVNTSCAEIMDDTVRLSASVFEHIEYRFAERRTVFSEPEITHQNMVFSCICMSHYLFPDLLNGKLAEAVNGPAVFGEIAYQLTNQSIVYVTIGDVSPKTEIL